MDMKRVYKEIEGWTMKTTISCGRFLLWKHQEPSAFYHDHISNYFSHKPLHWMI